MSILIPLLIYIKLVSCSNSTLRSANFITTITNGHLNDSWQFQFKLLTKEFLGIILHAFDSNGNQFAIHVRKGLDGERLITMDYNGAKRVVSAKELCGCSDCYKLHFIIHSEKSLKTIICNSRSTKSISLRYEQNRREMKDIKINSNPIQLDIRKSSNKILIMIGNIAVYIGEGNLTVQQQKEQMVGCLYFFYYNYTRLSFTGNNTRVSPSCPCNNNYNCNDGLCKDIDPHNYICDCSSTELNGRYCNRSLRMYDRRANNSYENVNQVNEIHLKMTWKPMGHKPYCLMDIISGGESAVIFTDKNYLFINSKRISNVNNADGINFVRVRVWNSSLIVKVKLGGEKHGFRLDGNIRITIGFSDNNNTCEIFEGKYDLHINAKELKNIYLVKGITQYPSNAISQLNTIRNESKLEKDSKMTKLHQQSKIKGAVPILLVCFVICFVVTILIYLMNRLNVRVSKVTTNIDIQDKDSFSGSYSETGIYGKVDDGCFYATIVDVDVYETIDA